MNARIFWRVVWKEARAGAGLWIAIALIGASCAGASRVAIDVWDGGPGDDASGGLFVVVLLFTALYAAGCGATIFSVERETGTFRFLQSLPISAWQVALPKITFAIASTVVLFGLSWVVAAVLCPIAVPWDAVGWVTAFFALTAAQGLAWGIFFSLRSKRPVVAALLAMSTASLCICGPPILVGWTYSDAMRADVFTAAWGAIVVAVAAADVLWARRWFREKAIFDLRRPWRRGGAVPPEAGAAQAPRLRPTGFRQLVWQETWESAVPMAALGVFVLLVWLGFVAARWESTRQSPLEDGGALLLALLLVLFATLAGSMAFLADWRRHGFRFLAERGVGPRTVWLSRLVVWVTPLVVALGALLLVLFLAGALVGRRVLTELITRSDIDGGLVESLVEHPGRLTSLLVVPGLVGYGLVAAVLGFSVGQFCSMLLRSGFVAAVAAVLSAYALGWWAGLMIYLGVPWLWSVVPMVPALLLATWLDAPDWLVERTGWRRRLRLVACVVAPAAAILVAVPLYRAFSVPLVEPGFSVEEFLRPDTPEETATLELYAKAAAAIAPWDSVGPELGERSADPEGHDKRHHAKELAQAEASPKAVELALEASRRKAPSRLCPPSPDGHPGADRWFVVERLPNLLWASGEVEQSKSHLDAALARYLGALRIASHLWRGASAYRFDADFAKPQAMEGLRTWAVAPRQTPQRIKAALVALDAIARERPTRSHVLKEEYVIARALIEGDRTRCDEETLYRTRWVRRLPWERQRAMGVLNLMTSEAFRWDAFRGAAPQENAAWPGCAPYRGPMAAPSLHYNFVLDPYLAVRLNQQERHIERQRRFTKLFLAVEGWRLEHGRWPESLDELVGTYFDRLPVDPVTGHSFPYGPTGLVPRFTG